MFDFITHPFGMHVQTLNASDEYEIPEVNSDKFLPIIPLILAGLIPGMNMNKTANRTAIRSTMYNLPVTPEPSVLLFFEMPVSFISPFPFFFVFAAFFPLSLLAFFPSFFGLCYISVSCVMHMGRCLSGLKRRS